MTSIKEFIARLNGLTRQYQSSFETGPAVTDKINQAQMELAEYLYSLYEINQRAVDLLSPLIVKEPLTSNSAGELTLPVDYNHRLDLVYVNEGKEYPSKYIGTNQVADLERLPQRKGDLAKNRVNHTFIGKQIQLYPKQALNTVLTYVRYPIGAKVAYTYQNINGEDVRTFDEANSVDLEWGENVMNLLLYMTLDKMGIATRNEILGQYAQLGIAKEEIKPIN